ncbi:MAG: hemerythrin domain-containing protein [Deltaproteobacteria bacterium]|nr:hemerythrin domain-containing protein [Deltaproteobacteria bacterium]MBW2696353.1 hemerythrin domain-containing protein [Deltaproteobacteria bacterium]
MTTNDEREQRAAVDQEHPAARVEEDHRTLRGQLDTIAAATTRTALLDGLLAVPKILLEHFALEEQIDGLYDDLRKRRPSLAVELDALLDQHRLILDEFDALSQKLQGRMDAERSVEQIAEPIMRDVSRWLERLRRHEREESSMIGVVYYTDDGGYG